MNVIKGKKEMVSEIYAALGKNVKREIISNVFDSVFDVISSELAEGNEVNVRNFGKFYITQSPAREVYNFVTGQREMCGEHAIPKFKYAPFQKSRLRDEVVSEEETSGE